MGEGGTAIPRYGRYEKQNSYPISLTYSASSLLPYLPAYSLLLILIGLLFYGLVLHARQTAEAHPRRRLASWRGAKGRRADLAPKGLVELATSLTASSWSGGGESAQKQRLGGTPRECGKRVRTGAAIESGANLGRS